jgi:hypothetical protein
VRRFLPVALLALSCTYTFADTLPVTSTLGVAELPIKDVAEFVFMPSETVAIRSTGSIVGIPSDFALETDNVWRQTFKVPDGKVMVITQFELPDTAKAQAWLEQMTETDPDVGWQLYSAYASPDLRGSQKPIAPLTTPLVLAPGKTFRLHTNALSVSARGYYLEESSSQ